MNLNRDVAYFFMTSVVKPFAVLVLLLLVGVSFAEVPEHNPALDSKCPKGFQWSKGIVGCAQADCPSGAGRTYTYGCSCGEAWDKPFRTCYDPKQPGLATSCVAQGAKCPGEFVGVAQQITVLSVEGDVEYSSDGGKTYYPLAEGNVLKQGDYITTGFDSNAKLDFGYATLRVTPLTNFRIDEFTSKEEINKTQLYLYVGAVMPRNLPHTAAVRGDFSVVTPTAISSIRDSEMSVAYNNLTMNTTVSVLEDKAFVKGINDLSETNLSFGETASVGSDGYVVKSAQPIPKIPGFCCISSAMVGLLSICTIAIAAKR